MDDHPSGKGPAGISLRRGLPMVQARDPEALDKEKAFLREVDSRPKPWQRWRGYWTVSGPGWVQSALTLGAGSAGSSIFAGAVFGYKLLWVQPVAMFLGVIMFSAIGHQLLSTQARPYDAFRKKLHPALAVAWGAAVLLASVVWQFPQYALGVSVVRDLFDVAGMSVPRAPVALALLVAGTALCWSYGRGSRRAIRHFERVLKYLLLVMVASFFLVRFERRKEENRRGAAQYLARNGARVGLTGFCLGGAVTIIGATTIPELAAGVVFYGIPPEQAAKPADVKIPLQAHFANKDDWCTPALVDGFEKAMKAAGKSLELFRYDAEHAFVNEQRQSVHDRGAAELAWGRATEFFKKHLG